MKPSSSSVIIVQTKAGKTDLLSDISTPINKEPPLEQKVAVMHAVWLCAYDKAHHEVVIRRAAKLLRLSLRDFREMLSAMDADWMDRVWCSRPANWKPSDSLEKPTY